MIKFGNTDMAQVMEIAKEAADYVTESFIKPIKLEFEKVYFPYLLINKKRCGVCVFDRNLHSRMPLVPRLLASNEQGRRGTNGIPLGCPPPLTVTTVKSV
jgi:hypothetical protein